MFQGKYNSALTVQEQTADSTALGTLALKALRSPKQPAKPVSSHVPASSLANKISNLISFTQVPWSTHLPKQKTSQQYYEESTIAQLCQTVQLNREDPLHSSVTRILLGGGVSVSDTYRIRIRLGYVSSRILKKQLRICLDTRIRYFWARWDTAQSSNQPTQMLFWQ